MHLYSVGKPYDLNRKVWPEVADYNYRACGHELRIFLARATPKEIETIRKAPAEFGLLVEPAGLVLVARFGPSLSFDCSYSWHRMVATTGESALPPPIEDTSPELRVLLAVVLVEATTGIILTLRDLTLSPDFTLALHRAILAQASGPADPAGHDRWVSTMMQYTTDQLWDRCKIRCKGGA